jgi:hypothetical protein
MKVLVISFLFFGALVVSGNARAETYEGTFCGCSASHKDAVYAVLYWEKGDVRINLAGYYPYAGETAKNNCIYDALHGDSRCHDPNYGDNHGSVPF